MTAVDFTDDQIADAYLYLFGRLLVVRQERHDIDVEKVGWNRIKFNTVGSADFVNPNLDVAYLEAWIAVDAEHAVTLRIPPITDRYYTVQIMDGWGEVVANVNERTFPDHPAGAVAFRVQGTTPMIADDALVIDLPGTKAKVLARVELQRTPETAVALQRQFVLEVPDGIVIAPTPDTVDFTNAEFPGADAFRGASALLETAPDSMPDAPVYQAVVRDIEAALTAPDFAARVGNVITTNAVPAFLATTRGFGTRRNGWSVAFSAGRFGNDVLARDVVNYGGIWANVVSEAIYYVGQVGSDQRLLNGDTTYEIRFPEGEPTDLVHAFWSLTLYSVPDYRVVLNQINRFGMNSDATLARNDDGSMSIWLAHARPESCPEANWLPTPAGREFALTLRLYVATHEALSGSWFPPEISALSD